MNATARRLQLLALLQAQPRWSGQALAERLGTTTRTIRRDVDLLRALGYRVDAVSGPEGGYALAAGTSLPPLVLDDDEAVAVALGLRAAALQGVRGLEDAAMTALVKLEQALPRRLRARLSALGSTVERVGPARRPQVDADVLSTLALACHTGEALWVTYRPHGGQPRSREVRPHRLVLAAGRWYLVGFEPRRAQWRTLRADRVTAAQPTSTRPRTPPPPDARALVTVAISEAPYQHQVTVRLPLTAEDARALVGPTGGTITGEGDTSLLRFGAEDLAWAAQHLVGLGCDFDVVAPAELLDHLSSLGAYLQSRYGHRTP